jgi:meiosis induction protein kinase IME2/SME1
MTVSNANTMALEDRFEVLKEIGDGSFGNVVLARVRTAGANVARRGTVVSPDDPASFLRSPS